MAGKLLVTGASGYLGAVVCARASDAGWEVVGTHLTHPAAGVRSVALDVRDGAAVEAVVARERPNAVIHTAYRQDGDDAWAINVEGSAHVAGAAARVGARLVHLSSDIVFSGAGEGPLAEGAALSPINAYGKSKAQAERVVAAAAAGAVIVRTSLIYGGPGEAPSKHEQLALAAARGELAWTFFSDELRNPVQVGDLASAVVELAALEVAGPLHVAGADTVDRHTFACLCAQAAGEPVDRLAAAPAPPGRPRNLTLDVSRAQGMLRTRLRGVREVLR